MRIFLD